MGPLDSIRMARAIRKNSGLKSNKAVSETKISKLRFSIAVNIDGRNNQRLIFFEAAFHFNSFRLHFIQKTHFTQSVNFVQHASICMISSASICFLYKLISISHRWVESIIKGIAAKAGLLFRN